MTLRLCFTLVINREVTIYLWEKNRIMFTLAQIPKIIEFLGDDPFEERLRILTALDSAMCFAQRISGILSLTAASLLASPLLPKSPGVGFPSVLKITNSARTSFPTKTGNHVLPTSTGKDFTPEPDSYDYPTFRRRAPFPFFP